MWRFAERSPPLTNKIEIVCGGLEGVYGAGFCMCDFFSLLFIEHCGSRFFFSLMDNYGHVAVQRGSVTVNSYSVRFATSCFTVL